MKYTQSKKLNHYIALLMDKGWVVVRSKVHLVLRSPDGQYKLHLPKTIPDRGSTMGNYISRIRRYL